MMSGPLRKSMRGQGARCGGIVLMLVLSLLFILIGVVLLLTSSIPRWRLTSRSEVE